VDSCLWMDLAGATKPLLVIHGVVAGVLTGACVHNGLIAWSVLRGGHGKPRLQRLYTSVSLWGFLFTFALGLAIYPQFRVDVRGAYLDANVPLATAAFEIKEHWMALGIGLLALLQLLAHRLDLSKPSEARLWYQTGTMLVMAIVIFAGLTGLTLTAIRPV